jgi:hypothetical protein
MSIENTYPTLSYEGLDLDLYDTIKNMIGDRGNLYSVKDIILNEVSDRYLKFYQKRYLLDLFFVFEQYMEAILQADYYKEYKQAFDQYKGNSNISGITSKNFESLFGGYNDIIWNWTGGSGFGQSSSKKVVCIQTIVDYIEMVKKLMEYHNKLVNPTSGIYKVAEDVVKELKDANHGTYN